MTRELTLNVTLPCLMRTCRPSSRRARASVPGSGTRRLPLDAAYLHRDRRAGVGRRVADARAGGPWTTSTNSDDASAAGRQRASPSSRLRTSLDIGKMYTKRQSVASFRPFAGHAPSGGTRDPARERAPPAVSAVTDHRRAEFGPAVRRAARLSDPCRDLRGPSLRLLLFRLPTRCDGFFGLGLCAFDLVFFVLALFGAARSERDRTWRRSRGAPRTLPGAASHATVRSYRRVPACASSTPPHVAMCPQGDPSGRGFGRHRKTTSAALRPLGSQPPVQRSRAAGGVE